MYAVHVCESRRFELAVAGLQEISASDFLLCVRRSRRTDLLSPLGLPVAHKLAKSVSSKPGLFFTWLMHSGELIRRTNFQSIATHIPLLQAMLYNSRFDSDRRHMDSLSAFAMMYSPRSADFRWPRSRRRQPNPPAVLNTRAMAEWRKIFEAQERQDGRQRNKFRKPLGWERRYCFGALI